MEDALELYARPYKRNEQVLALDEIPVQLFDPRRPGTEMYIDEPARTASRPTSSA